MNKVVGETLAERTRRIQDEVNSAEARRKKEEEDKRQGELDRLSDLPVFIDEIVGLLLPQIIYGSKTQTHRDVPIDDQAKVVNVPSLQMFLTDFDLLQTTIEVYAGQLHPNADPYTYLLEGRIIFNRWCLVYHAFNEHMKMLHSFIGVEELLKKAFIKKTEPLSAWCQTSGYKYDVKVWSGREGRLEFVIKVHVAISWK